MGKYKKNIIVIIIGILIIFGVLNIYESGILTDISNTSIEDANKTDDIALDNFIKTLENPLPIHSESVDNYDILQSWAGIYSPVSPQNSTYQYVGIKFYYNDQKELYMKILCHYYGDFDPYHSMIRMPSEISTTKIDDILYRNYDGTIIF